MIIDKNFLGNDSKSSKFKNSIWKPWLASKKFGDPKNFKLQLRLGSMCLHFREWPNWRETCDVEPWIALGSDQLVNVGEDGEQQLTAEQDRDRWLEFVTEKSEDFAGS